MYDEPNANETDRQRLLDQILDPRNRAPLLALYSQLHIPRPHHYDVPVSRGIIHSLPTIADEYVRFTIRFYNHRTRRFRRREARCKSVIFAASCPDATQGDLIEIVATNDGDDSAVREIVYIHKLLDKDLETGTLSGIERLIEIMGALLALLPPANESGG